MILSALSSAAPCERRATARLASAVAGQPVGRLQDRERFVAASVVALALALISLIIASLSSPRSSSCFSPLCCSRSPSKPLSVLNQMRLFAVDVNARSQLNTAFVTSNFIGGPISCSLAEFWQSGGWFSLTAGAAGAHWARADRVADSARTGIGVGPASNFLKRNTCLRIINRTSVSALRSRRGECTSARPVSGCHSPGRA